MTNQQLLSAFYSAHHDELLAFAANRMLGSCEAEDLVQDTFVRLLEARMMICETTVTSLVYTILRRLITDYYRRHTSRQEYEHYLQHGTPTTDSPESVYSAIEVSQRLEHGLARLPEKSRQVYRLHVYGGLRVSEISQQLGQNYKTVEARLGVARKHIRHYLKASGF